ncbi:MAG TPA: hypothetical protein ENK77_00275 [Epsilonproteobacteria bacterium]|nr:hypothetical protein [Campylobacterota bacterium]
MREIPFTPKAFYANYFWSVHEGYKIKEDILVKTYLSNFFTFRDIVTLYSLVGKEKLLAYAKEVGVDERIKKIVNMIEKYA